MGDDGRGSPREAAAYAVLEWANKFPEHSPEWRILLRASSDLLGLGEQPPAVGRQGPTTQVQH
jgi:hypothetical protein